MLSFPSTNADKNSDYLAFHSSRISALERSRSKLPRLHQIGFRDFLDQPDRTVSDTTVNIAPGSTIAPNFSEQQTPDRACRCPLAGIARNAANDRALGRTAQ